MIVVCQKCGKAHRNPEACPYCNQPITVGLPKGKLDKVIEYYKIFVFWFGWYIGFPSAILSVPSMIAGLCVIGSAEGEGWFKFGIALTVYGFIAFVWLAIVFVRAHDNAAQPHTEADNKVCEKHSSPLSHKEHEQKLKDFINGDSDDPPQ